MRKSYPNFVTPVWLLPSGEQLPWRRSAAGGQRGQDDNDGGGPHAPRFSATRRPPGSSTRRRAGPRIERGGHDRERGQRREIDLPARDRLARLVLYETNDRTRHRLLPHLFDDPTRAVGENDAGPRRMLRNRRLKHVDDFRIEVAPAAGDDELVAGVRRQRSPVRPIRGEASAQSERHQAVRAHSPWNRQIPGRLERGLPAGGGALRTAPLERVPQPFLETDDGGVAEELFGLRDVGLRVLDVAGAHVLVDRRQVGADDPVHDREELV